MPDIKDKIHYGISVAVGGLLGYANSLYGKYAADINFRVRPELAKLEWYEVIITDHFGDWLWKMHPEPMTLLSVVGIAAICAVTVAYFKH
jgi:hypothetical protein